MKLISLVPTSSGGHQDPWIFTNLLDEMDQFLEQLDLLEDKKNKFLKMKLKGRGKEYWYNMENVLLGRNKPAITDCKEQQSLSANVLGLAMDPQRTN